MKQVSHSRSFTIDQPVDRLFPLFSAEGEKHWVPGWDYINIMGRTTHQEDDVFLTETHDHASRVAIWLVKRHEPQRHFVQFYKVEPDDKVGVISVNCTAREPSSTKVTVAYRYIGLSEQGNEFIEGFTAEAYTGFIGEWEQLLNACFARIDTE